MRHTISTTILLVLTTTAYAQVPESPDAPEAPKAAEAPPAPETPEIGIRLGGGGDEDVSLTRRELELTPEIVDKLEAEQLHALLKEKELTKRSKAELRAGNVGPEIAAPIGFFLCVMVIVFLPLFFRWRREILLHGTLRAMVEKGAEIPVELITPPQKPKHNDLRRGVILAGLGLGLSLFLGLLPNVGEGVWACGLIPMLMGAGYLVVWRLQRREEQANSRPE